MNEALSPHHPVVISDLIQENSAEGKRVIANIVHGENAAAKRVNQLAQRFSGTRYAQQCLAQLYTEANKRYSSDVPPGFCDDARWHGRNDSRVDAKSAKRPPDCFADFIIWKQILDHAISTKHDVILVIDDYKPDWWDIGSAGELLGPRSELRDELRRESGQHFEMLTLENLRVLVSRLPVPAHRQLVAVERTIPESQLKTFDAETFAAAAALQKMPNWFVRLPIPRVLDPDFQRSLNQAAFINDLFKNTLMTNEVIKRSLGSNEYSRYTQLAKAVAGSPMLGISRELSATEASVRRAFGIDSATIAAMARISGATAGTQFRNIAAMASKVPPLPGLLGSTAAISAALKLSETNALARSVIRQHSAMGSRASRGLLRAIEQKHDEQKELE